MKTVVVVGGGISGLVAARSLAAQGWSVTVVEAGCRWGGKITAVELDGVRLDGGAESLLARRPEGLELIELLGLSSQQVHPTNAKPTLLIDGVPGQFPPSMMGVPTDLAALAPLLSSAGLDFARSEPDREAPVIEHDRPIGEVVDERFGAEVTDRLLEPMLGGVYAGDPRQLSFEAVAHGLYERARTGGSLLQHARDGARPADGPVFAGLAGGIYQLIDALVKELIERGATMRLATTACTLDRHGAQFVVTVGSTSDPERLTVDAVVLAAPARPTGRLLGGLDQTPQGAETIEAFSTIPYASVAVLTLIIKGLSPVESGLLVPRGGLPTIKALTYSSNKWSWIADQAERTWGPGVTVVRASLGRIGDIKELTLDSDGLLAKTFAEAAALPGWDKAVLITGGVSRWGGALPQYLVGHRHLIETLRHELADLPGLAVAGAALDGVGIAACLGSAELAVDKIIGDLAT